MENHLEGTFPAFEPNLYLLPAHFQTQDLISNYRSILVSIIHDFELLHQASFLVYTIPKKITTTIIYHSEFLMKGGNKEIR